MLQRHHPHTPGTFPPCAHCGREPHHIVSTGAIDTGPTTATIHRDVHHLECARCRLRTSRYATLEQAAAEWRTVFAGRGRCHWSAA